MEFSKTLMGASVEVSFPDLNKCMIKIDHAELEHSLILRSNFFMTGHRVMVTSDEGVIDSILVHGKNKGAYTVELFLDINLD